MLGNKLWGLLIAFTLVVVPVGPAAAHAVPAPTGAPTSAPASVAALQTGTTATTTAAVNLRTGAGTTYTARLLIPVGARVVVTAGPVNTSWYQVTYNGISGYAHGAYLRQGPAGGGTRTGTATTTAAVNFRTGPGFNDAVLQRLPAGASVSIVSGPVNSVWYQVTYAGRTGYVHGSYLAPAGTGGGTGSGKLIIVDLSDQRVYAYEGGTQVFAAPTSTGKEGFRTPTGTFTIVAKYRTKTMQGTANGESWYADNVPYVMFFTNRGHALHGAPWLAQSVFGSGVRRSHGCVNLPVNAAGWFYQWAPVGTTVQVRS